MAIEILGKASSLATSIHVNQRYGRKPYHVHLMDVALVLRRFFDWDELPQEYIDAAWLHDSIEDTSTTRETIQDIMGERVADLVFAVTNPTVDNKSLRDQLLYEKIKLCPGAINIKLADRIANVEQCISYGRIGRKPSRLFKRYLDKWPGFKSMQFCCAGEGYPAREMWEHLEMLFLLGVEALAQPVQARRT